MTAVCKWLELGWLMVGRHLGTMCIRQRNLFFLNFLGQSTAFHRISFWPFLFITKVIYVHSNHF